MKLFVKCFFYIISTVLLLLTILIVIPSFSLKAEAENSPPSEGDWIINERVYVENEEFELKGNVTINSGGELILKNTTLIFRNSMAGEFGIEVKGGRLRITDMDGDHFTREDASVLKAENSSNPYFFRVYKDSELKIENSKIMNCGFTQGGKGENLGLWSESEDVSISGSNLSYNYCGLVLYKVKGVKVVNTTFYRNSYGIYLYSSNKNTIEGCSFLENPLGIYLHMMSNHNILKRNMIFKSEEIGVCIHESNFNHLEENYVFLNNFGIFLDGSNSNYIGDSNISFNNEGVVFLQSDNNWLFEGYADNIYRSFSFNDSKENMIENYLFNNISANKTNASNPIIYLTEESYKNKLINSELNHTAISCENGSIELAIRLDVSIKDSLYQPIKECDLKIVLKNTENQEEKVIYASSGYGGTDNKTNQNGFVKGIVVSYEELVSDGEQLMVNHYKAHAYVKKDGWSQHKEVSTNESHVLLFIKKLNNVVVVDKNGEGDYTTVAEALERAKTDALINTIFIHSGVYVETENLEIDKGPLYLIGESEEDVTIMPVEGHQNGKYGFVIGVYIAGSEVFISNMSFEGWEYGIYVDAGEEVTLTDITFKNSSNPSAGGYWKAVGLFSSDNNLMSNLTIEKCDVGIFLSDSSSNKITNSRFSMNKEKALMFVAGSENNEVRGCVFEFSVCGVFLSDSSKNLFQNNFYGDSGVGVYLEEGSDENIFRGEVLANDLDIYINSCEENSFINLSFFSSNKAIFSTNSDVNYLLNPFTDVSIQAQEGKILIGFYLTLLVKDENDDAPVKGVETKVVNMGEVVYATAAFGGKDKKTNAEGMVKMIPVYYGAYADNNFTTYTTEIYLNYNRWNTSFKSEINNSKLLVFYENQRPLVEIVSFTNVKGVTDFEVSFYKGELITGRAEAEDDGEIVEYLWYMVREDGKTVNLSHQMEFEFRLDEKNITELFIYGRHTVYVKVKDNLGVWSEADSYIIEIKRREKSAVEGVNLSLLIGGFFALGVFIFLLLGYIMFSKFKYLTKIEDIFIIYKDGREIHHETRRMRPVFDSDLIASMFTAVQDFIADSFKDEKGELGRLDYGDLQILVERGEHLFAAVVLTGDVPDTVRGDIKELVKKIESEFADAVKEWSGDPAEFRGIRELIQKEFYEKIEKKPFFSYLAKVMVKKKRES